MRKHIALMATVAALAVSPALAQTTQEKQDSQRAPQAQPSTQAPSGTQAPAATTTQAPAKGAMSSERFVDMQASGQWLVSDLMSLNVVGANNENIGSVSDMLVDEEGNIHAVIVGVGGFLGIGQKDVAISYESFNITRDKDGDPEARLTLTKEELENAPAFKKAENPRAASRPATPAKPANPRN